MKLIKFLFIIFSPIFLIGNLKACDECINEQIKKLEMRIEYLEEEKASQDIVDSWILFAVNDTRKRLNLPSYDWSDFTKEYKLKYGRDIETLERKRSFIK